MVRQRTHDDTRRHVTRTFTLAVVASVAIVIVSAMLLTESSPTWLGAVIAGIAAIPALVALRVGAINFAHRDGVERAVILRSTSIAFFATMATVLTYGLFESFADLPAASSRAFYSVGMATWAGVTSSCNAASAARREPEVEQPASRPARRTAPDAGRSRDRA